jgi:hypothetical protein
MHRAVGVDRALYRRINLIALADIASDADRAAARGADLLCDLLDRRGRSRGNNHLGALAPKGERDRPADPAAGSGDDRDAILQRLVFHSDSAHVG